ncbi:MAG: type III glutamate--ammonia ligase [Alphaproteobacteria bacterium]|nr:type III glutamate--ammonia ligase [Alphaproteobacteria bacterium]
MARGGSGKRKSAQSIRSLAEQGVRYGLASYVDIHGRSKAKCVPIDHFDRMLKGSELFTGAALDGVPQEVNDDEVAAMPDLAHAMVMPWQSDIAWFPSDLWLNGKPFEACSRNILKRATRKAADLGYIFNLGIETEFYIFRENADGSVAPGTVRDDLDKPAYDVRQQLNSMPVLDQIVSSMNKLGWDVYSFDQEDATGQFETDFAYCDALLMADRFTFFRLMVGEIARMHGLFASFMPKPYGHRTGSGAHYNMSLADIRTGKNLFEDAKDRRGCGLSKLGYHFIAGVLAHANAISAVIAPTVNSYKRLIARGSMSGFTWAPIFACYGNNNRTNLLRIPMGGGRIECRAADIACNLYLGAAMVLTAGLEGIRKKMDPGEPHRENMYLHDEKTLKKLKVEKLPRTLGEAVEAFAADPLGREVMGDLMFETFVKFKAQEWIEYHSHVSDWEIKRYLRFF